MSWEIPVLALCGVARVLEYTIFSATCHSLA
jgi:hypothetical protein